MFSPYSTLLSLNVFSAAELRKRIFGHLDKRRLADCARVCVIWSDDALDLIWKELGSVRPLLSILCPLTKNVSRHTVPKSGRNFNRAYLGWGRMVLCQNA